MNVQEELQENAYVVTHRVGSMESGLRLDAFLKMRYHRWSRERLKKLIYSGSILIDRGRIQFQMLGEIKPSTCLLQGDKVQVCSERKPEPEVDFRYQVLFEDADLLVINKPSNLPVHPAGRYFFNTLILHLKTESLRKHPTTPSEHLLVHRIDRETSGVLVLSRSKETCEKLVAQFRTRKTKKRYLAISFGAPDPSTLGHPIEIQQSLGRSLRSPIRLKMDLVSVEDGGQEAKTTCIPEAIYRDDQGRTYTLWNCHPHTGRQHQIRIHLQSIGYPLVGDKLYGLDDQDALQFFEPPVGPAGYRVISDAIHKKLILPRHALHAAELGFHHPRTGIWQSICAPLAPDLSEFIATLECLAMTQDFAAMMRSTTSTNPLPHSDDVIH